MAVDPGESRDVDSAGVYYMTIEEFESRSAGAPVQSRVGPVQEREKPASGARSSLWRSLARVFWRKRIIRHPPRDPR